MDPIIRRVFVNLGLINDQPVMERTVLASKDGDI